MSTAFSEIEQQARRPLPDERVHLAELLLESLRDEPSQEIGTASQNEIEARVAAYDRGNVKTFPAEDGFAEAKHLCL